MMFQRNKHFKPKNKKYFDHIQSEVIKNAFMKFQKHPQNKDYQEVNLGETVVDFLAQRAYKKDCKDIPEEQYEFEEVFTQKRDFRNDPSRFATNIATDSLKHGNDGEYNKLGWDWARKNNKMDPTPLEILIGIKNQ